MHGQIIFYWSQKNNLLTYYFIMQEKANLSVDWKPQMMTPLLTLILSTQILKCAAYMLQKYMPIYAPQRSV